MPETLSVAVVGTGYVGLVSGVCLAAKGHRVTCLDLRAEVVDQLNRGIPHIHEQGLPELLRSVLEAGRFRAELAGEKALEGADLILVAVGTPSENGRIDLQFIGEAARMIGRFLRSQRSCVPVIVKSTVTPGTTDTFVRSILERESGRERVELGLGMNPEFLREGEAVRDFMEPDRIVLGHDDLETLRLLEILYAPWDCEKIAVNTRTAEMIKYANNCLLALQISAVNELANIASSLGGIDIADVMAGVHADKRWSPRVGGKLISPGILEYLKAGCGFGGSCFPKDVQAMRTLAADAGVPPLVLQAVLDVNAAQPLAATRLLENALEGGLSGKRILLLGCAFKPETDDVRESASLRIAESCLAKGADVVAHDPIAGENFKKQPGMQKVHFVSDWRGEISAADAVIVATAWREYLELQTSSLLPLLKGKPLIDARRMLNRAAFPETSYFSIGLSPRLPKIENLS